MSDGDGRSRWWAGFEELGADPSSVADPWSVDEENMGLSDEQVRFLESLADQPRVPRLATGLPGVDHPGINPAAETGD